jgi:hypothetical protein
MMLTLSVRLGWTEDATKALPIRRLYTHFKRLTPRDE